MVANTYRTDATDSMQAIRARARFLQRIATVWFHSQATIAHVLFVSCLVRLAKLFESLIVREHAVRDLNGLQMFRRVWCSCLEKPRCVRQSGCVGVLLRPVDAIPWQRQ